MENPFELILERLDRIEKAIERLNANDPNHNADIPMNVKEVASYLHLAVATIYGLTHSGIIPYYKTGKKLYFKKDDIDEWIFSKKRKTHDDIAKEAMEYIRKNPIQFK
jgi:excisionase family DNA binding protein